MASHPGNVSREEGGCCGRTSKRRARQHCKDRLHIGSRNARLCRVAVCAARRNKLVSCGRHWSDSVWRHSKFGSSRPNNRTDDISGNDQLDRSITASALRRGPSRATLVPPSPESGERHHAAASRPDEGAVPPQPREKVQAASTARPKSTGAPVRGAAPQPCGQAWRVLQVLLQAAGTRRDARSRAARSVRSVAPALRQATVA